MYTEVNTMVNINDKEIKRRQLGPEKCKVMNIRISHDLSKFLSENDISPTGLFNAAAKEIGYKGT